MSRPSRIEVSRLGAPLSLSVLTNQEHTMSDLTHCPAWRALAEHADQIRKASLRDLFAEDPGRFERFSLKLGDLLFDYSKNRITTETMRLLTELAEQRDVKGWRDRMFSGEKINLTEGRAVLHVALRNRGDGAIRVEGDV